MAELAHHDLAHHHDVPISAHGGGRIGPNAIIRVAEAIRLLEDAEVARSVFGAAGLDAYIDALPQEMVDEREVSALQRVVFERLGPMRARAINMTAGRLTADYLLANRIPKPAQRVLRLLPARLASRALTAAIGKHAWTFAGTGTFTARPGRPTIYEISHCPLCRDRHAEIAICDFYTATFETLFRYLVHPNAKVREIECEARGAHACRFEISW